MTARLARRCPRARAARRDYRIALVCLGNICRSPMAEVVLSRHSTDAGLDDRVEVVSSGTGDWHVGNPMDRRAAATADRARVRRVAPPCPAVQPVAGSTDCDLVLAMDAANLADLRDACSARPRAR